MQNVTRRVLALIAVCCVIVNSSECVVVLVDFRVSSQVFKFTVKGGNGVLNRRAIKAYGTVEV